MTDVIYHSTETSSDAVADVLSTIESDIGFIPNIFSVVAESEQALQGLVALSTAFNHSLFRAEEQQIILMATSVENECIYCVAGHSAFAESLNIPANIIAAMRNKQLTGTHDYNVLANTVRQLIEHRGQVAPDLISNFINAGYSKAQFLELIMGVCVKTFTNYVSNALNVQLDDAFKPFVWQRPSDINQQIA
jgi:uncharacterized peroxidase-related enzyme